MNIQLNDIRPDITRAVKLALEEDIGSGDITALLIPEGKVSTATVITREDGVLCGQTWFDEVFNQLGGITETSWHHKDGDWVEAGSTLVTLRGNSRLLLTGERTALNFLQTLMGTATSARRYADAAAHKNITILDTRKTLPGLRSAQKYAIQCGGCQNHRMGLYDAFLIKENHIAACGSIGSAIERARNVAPDKKIIVEVEGIAELEEAVAATPDQIMLDNFNDADVLLAYRITPMAIALERSGNVSLEELIHTARQSRPLYLSSGALTKHLQAVDLSLRLQGNLCVMP